MKTDIKTLSLEAIIAALYVIFTFVANLVGLASNVIQFRLSEILILLVIFNKKHSLGILVGTFISNWIFGFGLVDAFIGTSATLLSIILMILVKNMIISIVFPVIFNGTIVGLELYYIYNLQNFGLGPTMAYVAIGELVVLVFGVIVFKIISKNKKVVEFLELSNG